MPMLAKESEVRNQARKVLSVLELARASASVKNGNDDCLPSVSPTSCCGTSNVGMPPAAIVAAARKLEQSGCHKSDSHHIPCFPSLLCRRLLQTAQLASPSCICDSRI